MQKTALLLIVLLLVITVAESVHSVSPDHDKSCNVYAAEIDGNSVESKRPSELIDYATATAFAIGFLETAFAIVDSSAGI